MIDESRFYTIPCLIRKPLCSVDVWAESRHFLSSTSQMYSYKITPFMREPARFMSDLSGTSSVVLKTPAQAGKTLTIMNFLGWMCEYYPSNTLLVLDSQKQAIKLSGNRIRPFLRDICGINNPRNTKKNPDKSNSAINIGLKSGANLFMASAKSASDSKSTPARFVLLDEIDAYPEDINGEGDPITLFTQRAKRFRGMIIMTSTPTTDDGAIVQNWRLGTAQTWGVVCECGCWMDVRYQDLDYTNDIPVYTCKKCGTVYNEDDIKRLDHRYNEPTNLSPMKDGYGRIRRSYEVTAPLCHSFVTWKSLKEQEIAALSIGENSYKSFVNTVLGEVYIPKDDVSMDWPELMRITQSAYKQDCIPLDVSFIVCGVDTHDSCLYVETCGFSKDCKRMYGLGYKVLVGDPNEKDVWNAFEELFRAIYTREDSMLMRPVFAFCDSGGHRTNAVYMHSFRNRRFMPVKGFVSNSKRAQDPLIGKLQKIKLNAGIKGKCFVQMVGVNAGKDELQHAEIMTNTGDQRLYYPRGCGYDTEYFKGLLSEKKIDNKWVAPQKGHTNNEPLDCRVYAMACARYYYEKYYKRGLDRQIIGVDEMVRKKQQKENIQSESINEPVQIVEPKPEPEPEPKPEPKPEQKPEQKPKKSIPHW